MELRANRFDLNILAGEDRVGDISCGEMAMHWLCSIAMHKALPSNVWNNGYFFSRCYRCGRDMIRPPSGGWKRIPRGMAVVWKPIADNDIRWDLYGRMGRAKAEPAAEPQAPPQPVRRVAFGHETADARPGWEGEDALPPLPRFAAAPSPNRKLPGVASGEFL
jgi:hypothetical protein